MTGTLAGTEGEAIPFNNSGTGPDTDLNDSWARPGKTIWARSTPIRMTAWQASQRTYIATAGMAGGVASVAGAPPDVWWGWEARVLPLTQWDPGPDGQRLRLKLDFWSRKVVSVSDCIVTWKIYEVS